MKHYINSAIIYAIMAMAGGVFFREFTKFYSFTQKTTLSVVHTHYFILGTTFFLILILFDKSFSFSNKKTHKILVAYHIGLNITNIMLLIRGITQVSAINISYGLDKAISGIAGMGHIILSISIILLMLQIKKSVSTNLLKN